MRWITELLLLTWTAGALDGLSYLSGGVFTANMTGNTVLLALHLVQHQADPAIRCLVSLGAFAAGCFAGALLLEGTVRRPQAERNLAIASRIELPLLLAFAFLWLKDKTSGTLGLATIVMAALALGVQSVAVRRLKIKGVVTTFITGTVTDTMLGLAGRTRGPSGFVHTLGLTAVYLNYLAAAFVAGYLSVHVRLAAVSLPIATLVPVMVSRKRA